MIHGFFLRVFPFFWDEPALSTLGGYGLWSSCPFFQPPPVEGAAFLLIVFQFSALFAQSFSFLFFSA